MPKSTRITVEKCCCGHPSCKDYWLVGVGKFNQGSGFTQNVAYLIASLLNDVPLSLQKAEERDA